MTTYLFILNDPAYGTERSYNGLRLAGRADQGYRSRGSRQNPVKTTHRSISLAPGRPGLAVKLRMVM